MRFFARLDFACILSPSWIQLVKTKREKGMKARVSDEVDPGEIICCGQNRYSGLLEVSKIA